MNAELVAISINYEVPLTAEERAAIMRQFDQAESRSATVGAILENLHGVLSVVNIYHSESLDAPLIVCIRASDDTTELREEILYSVQASARDYGGTHAS